MTTCSNWHWICILPVPVTLSKIWHFVPNLLGFFVVPVNNYRISCKLAYNLIDFCKFRNNSSFYIGTGNRHRIRAWQWHNNLSSSSSSILILTSGHNVQNTCLVLGWLPCFFNHSKIILFQTHFRIKEFRFMYLKSMVLLYTLFYNQRHWSIEWTFFRLRYL
jgi:hypothetical protein